MLSLLLFGLLGYLLGSIPVAYLACRHFKGLDIRKAGSGNVGALNSFLVTRSAPIGLAVLALDLLKGLLVVLLATRLSERSFPLVAAAALGALAGHNYSVWLGWKGGRGLATALGAVLAIAPAVALAWMALWGLAYAWLREINVASAVACLLTTVLLLAVPFPLAQSILLFPAQPAEVYTFVVLFFAVLLSRLTGPVIQYVGTHRNP